MKIENVSRNDYPKLLEVWEASVRATHDFLQEENIAFLKPLILEQYFDAVKLKCVRDVHGRTIGFCGVAENKLEMLFVRPDKRGCGVGSILCRYAINNMNVTCVDVNEQTPQALGFYEHIGFRIFARSAVDGQGNPFPLLHMKLD